MKTVKTNGTELAYLEAGDGPLVVLVHGFPDTAHTWLPTMDALAAAGFHVVAPFTRGYWPSPVPEDKLYDSDTLGRDLLGFIESFNENAILVGHDWGASAAYAAAGLDPYRIRLLVTLAIPHPKSIKPTPTMMWNLRHFAALRRKSIVAKAQRDNFAYIDELWRRWSPAWKDLPASETTHVKEAFSQPGCLEAACSYYRFIGLRLPKGHLADITVPTVAFAGEHDGAMKPRAFEKARHCFKASYEVIQVPGGHFMHREHPETFIPELVQVVRQFQDGARAAAPDLRQ
ncbi:MAG: alpha/beta hydrolase [Kofleriaceae bacterium]